jgi:hypothetical protein
MRPRSHTYKKRLWTGGTAMQTVDEILQMTTTALRTVPVSYGVGTQDS